MGTQATSILNNTPYVFVQMQRNLESKVPKSQLFEAPREEKGNVW